MTYIVFLFGSHVQALIGHHQYYSSAIQHPHWGLLHVQSIVNENQYRQLFVCPWYVCTCTYMHRNNEINSNVCNSTLFLYLSWHIKLWIIHLILQGILPHYYVQTTIVTIDKKNVADPVETCCVWSRLNCYYILKYVRLSLWVIHIKLVKKGQDQRYLEKVMTVFFLSAHSMNPKPLKARHRAKFCQGNQTVLGS